MQVVVIGGGVIGLAAAYFLTQHDDLTVTVLEQHALGSGSTERANGGIRAQFSTPENITLSQASIRFWETFDDRFDIDLAYRQHGYLLLIEDDATLEAAERNVKLQNRHGVPTRLLTPDEAHEICGELHTDTITAATFCPTDGYADPHMAVQGFATHLQHTPTATIKTNTAATDIHHTPTNHHPYTVHTPNGPLPADYVVNAAGPWSHRVARMIDLDLPLRLDRRQLHTLDPHIPVPESNPFTSHLDRHVSFRPERNGLALASPGFIANPTTTINPDAYPKSHDFDTAAQLLDTLNHITPYFGPNTQLRNGWAGLYTVTPDHNPIIHQHPPGFITATGFSGHGFMHAPATGMIIRDLVLTDTTTLVNLTPYSLDRFNDPTHPDHDEEHIVL